MNPIDIEAGLLTCNNNKALLKKLLKKFAVKYNHLDPDILGTCSNEERLQTEAFVHNMKGVSANLGALNLSKFCALFLQQLRSNISEQQADKDNVPLKKMYQEIQQKIKEVIVFIEQM